MVGSKNAIPSVRVTHIHVLDSEGRLRRALNLLVAIAQPDGVSTDSTNDNKTQGKASSGSERNGDTTDTS